MSAYENRLLLVWCTFTVLMVSALIPIIIWAVKSGQFSNNDAAQRLHLKSGIPEGNEDSKNVSS